MDQFQLNVIGAVAVSSWHNLVVYPKLFWPSKKSLAMVVLPMLIWNSEKKFYIALF